MKGSPSCIWHVEFDCNGGDFQCRTPLAVGLRWILSDNVGSRTVDVIDSVGLVAALHHCHCWTRPVTDTYFEGPNNAAP